MTKRDTVKSLELRLAKLFGKQSYYLTKSSCAGKQYDNDYSLVFEDRTKYYVSNGKAGYHEELQKAVNGYEYFFASKTGFEKMMHRIVERDNRQAGTLGLEPVVFKELLLLNKERYFPFYIGAVMEQTGRRFIHITTDLFIACIDPKCEGYFEEKVNRTDAQLKTVAYDTKSFFAILSGELWTREIMQRISDNLTGNYPINE